jgi:ferric-dicitrate binding protein FerR (iron transport regulator)
MRTAQTLRRAMPDNDVPWLLLERFYAGACTPEEKATLDSWLVEDPRRRLLVERLRTVFGDTPPTPDQADIERAWTKLETAIYPRPGRSFTFVALLATALIALLTVAWFVARHATR